MLDVIEGYSFSSMACQQALMVLDFLKVAFEDEEIEILKAFIKKNLSQKTYYQFESGRQTTNAHLATIIKMGLALKKMTHDEESSLEDKKDEDADSNQ